MVTWLAKKLTMDHMDSTRSQKPGTQPYYEMILPKPQKFAQKKPKKQ
jgi:hypothetical protein